MALYPGATTYPSATTFPSSAADVEQPPVGGIPTPPGQPIIAGVPFQRRYTVTTSDGVRYDRLLEHGGAVTRLRYFTGTNTSAAPVVDAGPFTSTDGVEWLSPAVTIPTAGTYTAVVTIRTTADPASVSDDVESLVTVYALGGVIDEEPDDTLATVVTLAEVKAHLNKTSTTHDAELQALIVAAEAEYVEHVGPLRSGTYTETHTAATTMVLRRYPVEEITAAVADGVTYDVSTLAVSAASGVVTWPWAPPYGVQVIFTYTAGGSLPANHREAIIADVVNMYALTQRGGTGRSTGSYSDIDDGDTRTPLVLFPRIRALAWTASIA